MNPKVGDPIYLDGEVIGQIAEVTPREGVEGEVTLLVALNDQKWQGFEKIYAVVAPPTIPTLEPYSVVD